MKKKLIVCIGFVILLTGCQDKEIAKLTADLEAARAETASLRKSCDATSAMLETKDTEIDKVKSVLAKVQAENTKLKQTARYFFDLGVEKLEAGATEANEEAAMKAFRTVTERFPNDPLASAAAGRVDELTKRIAQRGEIAAKLEEKVRAVVKLCRDKATAATRARESGGEAGAKRADALDEAAKKAKEKAAGILEGGDVPDADGELASAVAGCDAAGAE